jgi:molybdopterin converting factor subunit 1
MPQMNINLLFFALYRELAGGGEKSIVVPPGATVAELVRIVRRLPGLERLPEDPVVAVNQEYASPDQVLHDSDEVAFLPPVAGG